MNKRYIVFFLICVLIFTGCETYNLSTYDSSALQTEPSVETIEETVSALPTNNNIEQNMLCRSFGFYKGSKRMREIHTISFSTEHPKEYDECWNASISDANSIKGYLIGEEVVIVGEHIYANEDCSNMFAAYNVYGDQLWSNLIKINGLELLDTSYVENMTTMFAFSKLTELNGIGQWDVSNVKKFSGMFQGNNHAGDVKFKYLDIGNWDTSSAENMSHIFYGCASMEYIPIENWDVSNVKTFSHMFADCFNLKHIDFSNWDTSSAESFNGFLNDCRSLIVVDVSNFNTKNCNQFSQMFESCTNLRCIIGLENWDVSNANYYAFSETFSGCCKLEEINIQNWVATPDNTARMFKDCYSLVEIDISGFDMTNNLNTTEMFMNCNAVIKK